MFSFTENLSNALHAQKHLYMHYIKLLTYQKSFVFIYFANDCWAVAHFLSKDKFNHGTQNKCISYLFKCNHILYIYEICFMYVSVKMQKRLKYKKNVFIYKHLAYTVYL